MLLFCELLVSVSIDRTHLFNTAIKMVLYSGSRFYILTIGYMTSMKQDFNFFKVCFGYFCIIGYF